MTLGDEEILLSIVVEVLQANTPSRGYAGQHPHAGLGALVTKGAVAVVVKHPIGLAGQGGHDYVRPSVIIIVLQNHSHTRQGHAIHKQSSACLQAHLGESAIMVIVKQMLLHAVISDVDVGETITVVVRECDSQTVPFFGGNA